MENRNYILDTDIGPDCDDAAALALAVLYARRHADFCTRRGSRCIWTEVSR